MIAMKIFTLICCFLTTFTAQAQLIEKGGELFLMNTPDKSAAKSFSFGKMKKVEIGSEKTHGEIAILSDVIFHQDLKLYVVDAETGKVSRIDLDEKSAYYGSVEIVSKLVVRHDKKLYEVNPKNGNTKEIKE